MPFVQPRDLDEQYLIVDFGQRPNSELLDILVYRQVAPKFASRSTIRYRKNKATLHFFLLTLRLMASAEKSTCKIPSELLPPDPVISDSAAASPFGTILGFSTTLSGSELCEFSECDWCNFFTTSSNLIFFDLFIFWRLILALTVAKFSLSLDDESEFGLFVRFWFRFSFRIWRVFSISDVSFTFFVVDSVFEDEPFSALSLFWLEPSHFLKIHTYKSTNKQKSKEFYSGNLSYFLKQK